MGRAAFACVVAALAAGCLESPPSASPGGEPDAAQDGDAGTTVIRFPPPGAAVHVTAALAEDVDLDGRQDLILLDDQVDDDWAGVYVLRAGADGWSRMDEIQLGFRPTAAHFGRQVKPAGAALVVGGVSGQVAVVDYKPDDDAWVVSELAFDTPPGGTITRIHTGVRVINDETASLLIDDGDNLSISSAIDAGAEMNLSTFVDGGVLDAVFWPLRTGDPMDFILWRRTTQFEWYDGVVYGGPDPSDVVLARFAQVDADLCGAYLAVQPDASLAIGWIDCDGSAASSAPVEAVDLPAVTAMITADLAGGPAQDVALVGEDGSAVAVQVLIDIALVDDGTPSFVPMTVTDLAEIDQVTSADVQLTSVDAEADGSALLMVFTPSGTSACGQVVGSEIEPCDPRWDLTGP